MSYFLILLTALPEGASRLEEAAVSGHSRQVSSAALPVASGYPARMLSNVRGAECF